MLSLSGCGRDLKSAKLKCTGLFTFGAAGFTAEADVVLLLGYNGMLRGPSATVELDGDSLALQQDVDRMPIAVGEGDFLTQKVHVLAFLGVGDDAEHIADP